MIAVPKDDGGRGRRSGGNGWGGRREEGGVAPSENATIEKYPNVMLSLCLKPSAKSWAFTHVFAYFHCSHRHQTKPSKGNARAGDEKRGGAWQEAWGMTSTSVGLQNN